MPIEIRPIDTSKFGYTTNRYPAATAHSGAVYHYRIQTDDGFNTEWFGGLSAEFHHNTWPNRNYSVNLLTALKQLPKLLMTPGPGQTLGTRRPPGGKSRIVIDAASDVQSQRKD